MNKLEKARIYPTKRPEDVFYVQFNPNTLQYRVDMKSVNDKDGTDSIPKQRDATGQSGRAELSMTLFFYSFGSETDYGDVRKNINKLRPYLSRWTEKGQVMEEGITFAWGTITLEGYLRSMDVSYQMFASDGTPVQAEVRITIVGEDRDVKADNINHAQSMELNKKAAQINQQENSAVDPAESDIQIAWLFEGV